jgi:hypothetical protein
MSYFAVVTVATFNGGTEDINGYMPVILNPIFGNMPYNRILNGSIAQNVELETGKTYLVSVEMADSTNPKTGKVTSQPNVTNLGQISAMDLALSRKKFLDQMGAGKVESKVVAEVETEVELVEEGAGGVPSNNDDPLG